MKNKFLQYLILQLIYSFALIISSFYQLKMSISAMKFRFTETCQVRCNFCLNWISGVNLSKKNLHSCDDCLQRYILTDFEVHTIHGEIYKMHVVREQEQKGLCSKSFIDNLSELRSHHDHSEKLEDCNQIIEERYIAEQDQPQTYAINQPNPHSDNHLNLDFIKKMNSKSQFMNNQADENYQIEKHQSCIFNASKMKERKEPMTGAKSMKRLAKLQDFGRSLDKTRFLQRYQFYFDNETIKSYTNQHPKIERQFGDDLVNIPEFNLNNINSKLSVDNRSKTSRSNISSQMNFKHNKMEDQELKMRIEAGLQGKHQSETLHRIMAGRVRQAYEKTVIQNRTLQLISHNLEDLDFSCYLSLFDLDRIQTIKLIKVGLTDQQLLEFAEAISNKRIETLVLTGNKLTELSLNFFMNKPLPYLRELYLGKNYINRYKMKQNINELKTKFILYL